MNCDEFRKVRRGGNFLPHQTYSRTGQRYLADEKSKLVHDLDRETAECRINDTLKSRTAVSFIPDQLQQAIREGYRPCPQCLPAEAQQYEAEGKQQAEKSDASKEKPVKKEAAAAE